MQMLMIKILQFLGAIKRYYVKGGEEIEITDAMWKDQLKKWKEATTDEAKAAAHPNVEFKDWYWYDTDSKIKYGQAPKWVVEIVAPILEILNSLLVPVIILLGTAGMIYGIVLGVQYSKAETADKREELKKRLISAVIGIVIALVVLILLKIFVKNAASIFGWVTETSEAE